MKNFTCLFSLLVGMTLLALQLSAQLPADWANTDIGSPGTPGSATYDDMTGTFTLTGTGLLFWDVDDAHFAYVRIDGDFEFVARILTFSSVDGLGGSAKAGIDARNSLDTDAPSVMMAWEDWGGLATTGREGPGITPTWGGHNFPGAGAIPWYLRMVREGDVFWTSESLDGVTWEGTDTLTMNAMLSTIYVGLCISPNSNNVATATFDNVEITGDILASTKDVRNLNHQLTFYPNPVQNEVYLDFEETESVKAVTVSDLSGTVVSRFSSDVIYKGRLNVSDLASGLYFIQILTDDGVAVGKFIRN